MVVMTKWNWDRMAGIYLDGRRYDLALSQPRAAAEGTAERWKTPRETTRETARETAPRHAKRAATRSTYEK